VFSRKSLKLGLLACLIALAASYFFQGKRTYAVWAKETLSFVEVGSAVSAVAIFIALIATV
jgi:hypothetical protein